MIHVAICDDDSNIVEYIGKYLETKNKQTSDITLDISLYKSGEDFLRAIETGDKFQIVFMDIQMNDVNGVEVGKTLRSQPDGDDVIMIYISYYD